MWTFFLKLLSALLEDGTSTAQEPRLDADPTGNTQVGTGYVTNGVPVTNGLCFTTIDFGSGVFTGNRYWLEVDVKTNNAPVNKNMGSHLNSIQFGLAFYSRLVLG